MPTHTIHSEKEAFYFVTFTCYKWLPHIEACRLNDYFKGWLAQLSKRGIALSGYVFMANHMHLWVYVNKSCIGLKEVIGGSKRFMAYEIVNRLRVFQFQK
jgi:putative transposase